jgi:hypothetical protein
MPSVNCRTKFFFPSVSSYCISNQQACHRLQEFSISSTPVGTLTAEKCWLICISHDVFCIAYKPCLIPVLQLLCCLYIAPPLFAWSFKFSRLYNWLPSRFSTTVGKCNTNFLSSKHDYGDVCGRDLYTTRHIIALVSCMQREIGFSGTEGQLETYVEIRLNS